MEDDLLTLIGNERGMTNCIILTHNIDFVFLQTLVVNAAKKCGDPKITVFADAQCALDSYSYQKPFLSGLGSRFRVVPVSMEPGFRFHPKAVLLCSPKKAVLFVGSGNLTFGGWRDNAEVWTQFDTSDDGNAAFYDFHGYLKQVAGRLSLAEVVLDEIEDAFDIANKEWNVDEVGKHEPVLIGRAGIGASLLEQMKALADPQPEMRFQVCTPYFDSDGEAVLKLTENFSPSTIDIKVEPGRTNLSTSTRQKFPKQATVQAVRYVRKNPNGQDERDAFMHAKFFAYQEIDKVHVFVGSANCSRAALTIPGKRGNAELATSVKLSTAEFIEQFNSVLEFGQGDPLLYDPDESAENGEQIHAIHLSAARFLDGALKLAYSFNGEIVLQECIADGVSTKIARQGAGWVVVELHNAPTTVCLTAQYDGCAIESNELWVDKESALQITARNRLAGEIIRKKIESSNFGLGDWADVLEAFNSDCAYLPSNRAKSANIVGMDRPNESTKVTYGVNDIFTDSYDVHKNSTIFDLRAGSSVSLTLPQLFARWFGLSNTDQKDEVPDAEPGDDDLPPTESSLSLKAKDIKANKLTPETPRESEIKRAEKAVAIVVAATTAEPFLSQRQPEQLGRDIRICALLLATGVRNKFISPETFLNATRSIWAALFFVRFKDLNYNGWIERRLAESENAIAFINAMQSPQLAAALAGWAFAIPDVYGVEKIRFSLGYLLSIGRLPWLWSGTDIHSIAAELDHMLLHIDEKARRDIGKRNAIGSQWFALVIRGKQLYTLDQLLEPLLPVNLREQISQDLVQPGELLWQGKRKRFCIAISAFSRKKNENVEVLTLQDGVAVKFGASFVIPVAAILEEIDLQYDIKFGVNLRIEINALIKDFIFQYSQ
jgi:hypothetical protein